MYKKIIILLIITLLVVSCQSVKDKDKAQSFSKDYEAVQTEFKEKLKTINSQEAYQNLLNNRNKKFEELLKKYQDSPAIDEIEILRAKILLNNSKLDEAEKKIDAILAKKSEFTNDAKMTKVLILFARQKINKAVTYFKEIETGMEKGEDFYNAQLIFALYATDDKIKEEYSNKFIANENLPTEVAHMKPRIYANLAGIAKDRKEFDKAKEILKQAMDAAQDPRQKAGLQSELEQLSLMGAVAPGISAETWVNSKTLSLDKLKGKVVVIDFWATWCKPCRMVIPTLIEEYENNKDKGLVVIGFTKLYGNYRDDIVDKGPVDKKEENRLIKDFVKRHKINYPVAISIEGKAFETYKVQGIPTMVFIDKAGNISHMEVGVGAPENIKNRIKKLLEE